MNLRRLRAAALAVGLWFVFGIGLVDGCVAATLTSTVADSAEGQAIYRRGVLQSGANLQGERLDGVPLSGAAAACVACHRPSGLGQSEGRIVVPPVTETYLFRTPGGKAQDMDFRYMPGFRPSRLPYRDDQALAHAIRDGIGRAGQPLGSLMPRYALDDRAMASLIAYLKTLSAVTPPGATADTLHIATIITPDADPKQRQGMLEVLEKFFADKNAFVRGGSRTIQSSREIVYRVTRRWQLHVWELQGSPDTWEAQLRKFQATQPVFAVLSGLGGATWQPVHRFCEAAALPCLMPNVDLPVDAEADFYPLYFSKGVLLEAQLMLARLGQQAPNNGATHVVQLAREGDIGRDAAAALQAGAATAGLSASTRLLSTHEGAGAIAATLRGLRAGDTLVLWLRPADLQALGTAPPPGVNVVVSGLMGGLEAAPLPVAWRGVSLMSYPMDLPEARRIRLNFALSWFKIRQIPMLDERVQADTYLACGVLSETLNEMLDSFYGDYLVERIEMMISRRVLSGHYPRFGLAPGQRFLSKGGYLVRFAESDGIKVTADGDWIVP